MNFKEQEDFKMQDNEFEINFLRFNSRLIDDQDNIFDFDVQLSKDMLRLNKKKSTKAINQLKDNKDNYVVQLKEDQLVSSNKFRKSSVSTNFSESSLLNKALLKKCSCTKTRCMKNYCQCFKLGIKCNQECQCIQCKNSVQLFLLPSIITVSQRIKCKCKKSKCVKKYCQCHKMGKKCGIECNCIDCENVSCEQDEYGEEQIRKIVKSGQLQQYEGYLN